ncbi:carbohydrate kinase [Arcanobacterium haemolyticum]|nr:carbohydrate kinase [Arcanobacterium haemolyticum]
MSAHYVLGIDNGGTTTKAAIYDECGNVVALNQAKLEVLTPRPLFTERDMSQFWQANIRAIRRCLNDSRIDSSEIKAVAVTGHGNGVYLATKDGQGVRPGVISTDGRAQEIVDEWLERPDFDARVRAKTASDVWAGQPAALLAWFDRHEPDVFDATDYVFQAKDYIRYMLTGQARMEISDFTGVSYADLETGELDDDVFDFFGISRWIPKIPERCGSTDIAGYITKEAAELTGLAEGTPVAGGAMDIAAGALAAGLTSEDELCVITGTWSINEVLSPVINHDEDVFLTLKYPGGSYLILEGGPNGVSNLDWYIRSVLRNSFQVFSDRELSEKDIFDCCEKMISEYTPSIDDPFFLPYVNGTSVIPEGLAGFVGLAQCHDIRHMVRAVYEGVIFSHLYHIEKLRRYTSLKGHVRFTGGAANSSMWIKMFADGIGVPLDVVDAEESGTLGMAILAAVAAGIHPDVPRAVAAMTGKPRETIYPDPEFAELFNKRFARFSAYIDALASTKKEEK